MDPKETEELHLFWDGLTPKEIEQSILDAMIFGTSWARMDNDGKKTLLDPREVYIRESSEHD